MKLKTASVILAVCGGLSNIAQAVEIEISGYASFLATKGSNEQNSTYFHEVARTDNVEYSSSETHIGVQFNAPVSDKIDIVVLMEAEGGANSTYQVETEWAYANYKFNEDWALRIGKIKGPFFMVSDYRNVGYAYPWVRPPLEVYHTNPITSFSGFDMVFQKSVNDINYLMELYTGSGNNRKGRALPAAVDNPLPGYTITDKNALESFETHDMYGVNASIGTDTVTFRLGYLATEVNAGGLTNIEGSFSSVGMIVDWRNIVFYSEYIEREADALFTLSFPDQKAWYATLGYRMNKFLPYVTYANVDEGKDATPYAVVQSSIALGLRYELADAAAIKFEAMQVDPKENGLGRYGLYNDPLSGTEKGQIYTASFDIIF